MFNLQEEIDRLRGLIGGISGVAPILTSMEEKVIAFNQLAEKWDNHIDTLIDGEFKLRQENNLLREKLHLLKEIEKLKH